MPDVAEYSHLLKYRSVNVESYMSKQRVNDTRVNNSHARYLPTCIKINANDKSPHTIICNINRKIHMGI